MAETTYFRFDRTWQERIKMAFSGEGEGPDPSMRWFSYPPTIVSDASEAKQLHRDACRGLWVLPHMHAPHVSALYLVRGGRSLELDGFPHTDVSEADTRRTA